MFRSSSVNTEVESTLPGVHTTLENKIYKTNLRQEKNEQITYIKLSFADFVKIISHLIKLLLFYIL